MASIGNSPTQQAFTPAIDYFSGNGSTTAFTLSRPVASVAQVQVTIDNVAQNPSSAFTVSSNTITFTSAPLSGTNNIYVYYTSPITQVIAPSQGTVDATSLASSTGTGAVVLATSPTITTPTINSISSAAATALTLKSAGTTAITVDTSQKVGIGTTSPTGILNVKGTGGDALPATSGSTQSAGLITRLQQGGGIGSVMDVGGNGGTGSWIQVTEASNLATNYNLLLNPNGGNLLVGETAVDNSGGLAVIPGYATGAPAILAFNKGNSANETCLRFKYQGTQVGSISYSNTATAYNTSSDYRLKEAVAPMTGALAKVALLKPCTYKWKIDGSDGQGFIAHELDEVVQGCVTGEKDAVDADGNPQYQGIDTSFLVATLTAALQETKALLDTQAETINALTARIVALENR